MKFIYTDSSTEYFIPNEESIMYNNDNLKIAINIKKIIRHNLENKWK